MKIARSAGTFMTGLGVPIVIDGVLYEQHIRFSFGLGLGIAGALLAMVGWVYERHSSVQPALVDPGDCPNCCSPLQFVPRSKGLHGARFTCVVCTWGTGIYYEAKRSRESCDP